MWDGHSLPRRGGRAQVPAACRRPPVLPVTRWSSSRQPRSVSLGGGDTSAAGYLAVLFRARCPSCSRRPVPRAHPTCPAPPIAAQINLFLRVMRRRPDGYHDLASLFHVIDLGDDMRFEELPAGAGADELACNMPGVPTDASNLVIKALDLFRRHTSVSKRFRVDLRKRVPHGAGMGGGSGNAATALWAANALSGRPASDAQLLEWAGEIGSDISVFFSRGAAYCTGR